MTAHSHTLPNGQQIAYQMERRSRRTIGLKITAEGLVVHVPKRLTQRDLDQILNQKASWILSKLESRQRQILPPITWHSGTKLNYLGREIYLEISPDLGGKKVELTQEVLLIPAPRTNIHAASGDAIKLFIIRWFKQEALKDFARRLEIFAAKLGVDTPKLALSNAQSRWGSCNSKREIRLNWRLIQAPPHIINYVVCHELAHLKEMNHSIRFWKIVGQLYPDYKQAEKELKAISPLLHQI